MSLSASCSTLTLSQLSLSESEEDSAVTMLKALGHPVRLRMVNLMHACGGELCVCQFEEHFDLTQPTISHHLRILKDAGLVDTRQDGTWVHHSLNSEALQRLTGHMASFSSAHEVDSLLISTKTES